MNFTEWEPIYKQIINDFGFDRNKDEHSAEVLKNLLKNKELITVKELSEMINGNEVFVFGAGIGLEEAVHAFDPKAHLDSIIIAADGATSPLIKHQIVPHIIVTDLDGFMEDQLKSNELGAVLLIHGHGDNISALKKWVPKFKGKLLGTTQAKPDEINNIFNFGGFTDGDRAIFLAAHFKAKKIFLIAFNFTDIGEYSFKYEPERKLRKLTWANVLIGILKEPQIIFLPIQSDKKLK